MLVALVVLGGAGLLVSVLARSLGWPVLGDAAVFHYTAWLIAHGGAPYRDLFDMNFPGIYLVHAVVLATLGPGSFAWRLFDLGWLAAGAALMYRYSRPVADRWSAAVGPLVFSIYHLSGGSLLTGQRDFLLCTLLLAGAHGVARFAETGGRRAPLFVAGLALGASMMLKPHTGLFWLGCLAAAALVAPRTRTSRRHAAGLVLGAGLIAPALVFAWLAMIGGLRPFLTILTEWTLPLYSQVRGAQPLRVLASLRWGLLLALGLAGAVARVPEHGRLRHRLALMGVGYGFLHFALQFKSWDYYLYPFAFFLCLMGSFAIAAAPASWRSPWTARQWPSSAALPVLVATLIAIGTGAHKRFDQPYDAQRERRIEEMVRDVRRLVRSGDTVQVMGFPGVPVLMSLGLRQPTRFLGDFVFFLERGDARTEALRAEFVAGLEAGRPAAILVMPEWTAPTPFARLEAFPALNRLLSDQYSPIEGWGYRIYARRPLP